MGRFVNLTKSIERIPELEKKCGIELHALSAKLHPYENGCELTILGELRVSAGGGLKDRLEIVAAAYSTADEMTGLDSVRFDPGDVIDFEAFQILILDMMQKPTKLRVYPKLR